MSEAQALIARAAFDRMIDERNEAKRACRPKIEPHGPVVTLVILPRAGGSLADIHTAADTRMGADYDRLCAETDAMLADILSAPPVGGSPFSAIAGKARGTAARADE
ncbi:hypothetical protein GNZ12_24115 [Paraburkholderia sp. 1N]|uniref:Uncharacterized protein n=1 Tax=Paraburkholderia solitsugae TaxID=2675748 RepID=A0ABX2BUN3_9BURK|nr:hypothetical protein [Paraburkholderia solitsugae]NPT44339.1 hypothetical protein [Paraburkholderia solitsugae]